ncbi:MAG: hypothetical protein Q4D26_09270 [Clostridia bacterium]|nr:hypothetical protein [Clostridia bacterium]
MNYKTKQDHPKMGLNNKICENPVAYCKSHQVYLSDADVTRKKCRRKPTTDLIGFNQCNWLVECER